jgi:phosphoribosylanthranilate isomerase
MSFSIKICGMKVPDNIREVAALHPDYMGFIFYPKSPRYAGNLDPETTCSLPEGICKVGVFVNELPDKMLETAQKYGLDAVQLHGNESPEVCYRMKSNHITVIKAISVADKADIAQADYYQTSCDYLLFDTQTKLHGGSGMQYDWNILRYYQGNLPFFLSGGIGPEDAERVLAFRHLRLHAIDINSRFESAPGLKNSELINTFFTKIQNNRT